MNTNTTSSTAIDFKPPSFTTTIYRDEGESPRVRKRCHPRDMNDTIVVEQPQIDLNHLYHNAVKCLVKCDATINTLETKLKSKDEQIASLEAKLIHMSLELAGAKTKADELEHKISKQQQQQQLVEASAGIDCGERLSSYTPATKNDQSNMDTATQDVVRSTREQLYGSTTSCVQMQIVKNKKNHIRREQTHYLPISSYGNVDTVPAPSHEAAVSSNDNKDTAASDRPRTRRRRGGFRLPSLNSFSFGNGEYSNILKEELPSSSKDNNQNGMRVDNDDFDSSKPSIVWP